MNSIASFGRKVTETTSDLLDNIKYVCLALDIL